MPLRFAAAISLVAVALVSPSRAEACSWSSECDAQTATVHIPGSGFPANAPGFGVLATGATVVDVRLSGPDGGSVPLSFETVGSDWGPRPTVALGVSLGTALGPGDHGLELDLECDGGTATRSHVLEVTPSSPLPTAGPTLALAEVKTQPYSDAAGEPGGGGGLAAVARFSITPPPGLDPFAGHVEWTLLVDGQPYARAPFEGTAGLEDEAFNTVFACCPGESCVYSSCAPRSGLRTAGLHRAKVEAKLAGSQAVLASNEVEFDLQCSDGPRPGGNAPDPAPDPAPDSSCASVGTAAAWLGLLGLIAALGRRRRA